MKNYTKDYNHRYKSESQGSGYSQNITYRNSKEVAKISKNNGAKLCSVVWRNGNYICGAGPKATVMVIECFNRFDKFQKVNT